MNEIPKPTAERPPLARWVIVLLYAMLIAWGLGQFIGLTYLSRHGISPLPFVGMFLAGWLGLGIARWWRVSIRIAWGVQLLALIIYCLMPFYAVWRGYQDYRGSGNIDWVYFWIGRGLMVLTLAAAAWAMLRILSDKRCALSDCRFPVDYHIVLMVAIAALIYHCIWAGDLIAALVVVALFLAIAWLAYGLHRLRSWPIRAAIILHCIIALSAWLAQITYSLAIITDQPSADFTREQFALRAALSTMVMLSSWVTQRTLRSALRAINDTASDAPSVVQQ